ncbi:hypothetical protein SEA_SPEEDDEMON_1240 [Gordonia phage SpeedDemon]|nr:hypothetical protein SEA_SPEEDDEMON_1240 [Gordonia phage SpeedDemon]
MGIAIERVGPVIDRERLRQECNAAVANGLMLQARRIERVLNALEDE